MKFAIAALLVLPLLASANDGVAGADATGIVFRKTDAIAMKKEVLSVSHQLISVDYEFVNESDKDVEETIVFPLPAYPVAHESIDGYYGQPNGFSIDVDGKPVRFRTEVRAMDRDADVTQEIRKIGLSDAQIAYHPNFGRQAGVPPLTKQQRRQLDELGLLDDSPAGEREPVWKVQVNYVWQQKFPVKKVVRVHHAYRPFVAFGPSEWDGRGLAKGFCADAAFLKSWNRLAMGDAPNKFLPAFPLTYILKTGNTWKNGIEDFTLNIVKGRPEEIVSLCFPGTFKKIDALTYQVHLRNFRPKDDLHVYFGNPENENNDQLGQMPVIAR